MKSLKGNGMQRRRQAWRESNGGVEVQECHQTTTKGPPLPPLYFSSSYGSPALVPLMVHIVITKPVPSMQGPS